MSIAAAENAGPGPCDLQDPLWVKMSAITGSVTKKRKKSDAKPQSQINKCLNEKRRRTQENQYIDELAELISATDMSSGKTDKCQILQRTVDQIRHIRQQENSNSHAVQQGEVSSSNPNIISNDQVGPMLLEALDGFLFVVNTEGRVEYVTDNISQYINYTKEDVFGKDIYNIIHHGDHNTFMPSLLPMSSLAGWTSEPQPQTKNRVFNCRFLVKPPDDKEETMEEKQQRVNKYETMQICSALLTNNSDRLESGDVSSESSDIGPCVMCVARRIPHNEKPITTAIQQFTVKLDPSGKILALDNSWLSQSYSTYLNKDLVGTAIQDLCHPLDLSELTAHLKGTLEGGERSSPMYRLCVSQDKFLNVKANSKLFKGTEMSGYDTDYVMSINSIIGDNDLTPLEGGQLSNNKLCSGHSSNRCANNSNNNNGNNNNNVGGPLMSVAHLNGQVSGVSGRGLTSQNATTSNNSVTFNTSDNSCNPLTSLTTSSNPFNQFSGNMDLEFELFPSSTWDLDSSSGWVERPESRASGPPNSRPPSQPAAASPSPQGTTTFNSNSAVQPSHCSPLRAYSPTSGNPTFSNSFPFSPLQESPTPMNNIAGAVAAAAAAAAAGANGATTSSLCKRIESQDKGCPSTSGTSAPNTPSVETQNSVVSTESVRLRNLLTKGASASEDSQDNPVNDADKPNKHRILKTLLNQQDDDEYHSEHSSRVRTSPSSAPKQNTEQPNIMLLQLLNEKNDDDDEEARVGLKKSNELLQKLLKNQDEERKQKEQTNQEDDPLLRSLGFQNTTPSPSQPNENSQVPRKRPGEEMNMNSSMKRPRDGTHPPASAPTSTNKHLWEKNKMLASLLAKQPEQPTKIPPIDASVISATPQDKLPRVTDRLKQPPQQQQQQQPWTTSRMQQPIGNNTITTTATSARTPLQNLPRQQLPRQAANVYLSHMLSQVSQTQQQRPQVEQIDSEFISGGEYRQPNTDPNVWNNQSTDPDLNDILEQFVDFTSNQTNEDSSETTNDLLSVAEVPHDIVVNETMAINAIQKSLMLIEAKVNSTSSSITIPGTPPAYSTALGNAPVVTTSHNYQAAALYQQQQQPRMRFNAQPGIRQSAAQFTPQQQLHIQQQQRSNLIQQQQMKQRLLQQQQQQQLLIPSNATATDQINTGIHNIDSLLNNTVAPNVSLQRSSVTDSQVSPGYGGSVQMPSGHRLAHSYSHPSTLSQHPVNNNFSSGQQVSATARLSPHSPAGILSFSHPQPLSPRVSQGNYGNSPRMFNVNQVRQQQQPTTQQQLQQQQRSMPSPGTPASARQSPFPAETFPPPASPTASQFPPVQIPNANNPSTQYRLQRTTSTPSATTQLPGGIGSPRHYGGVNKEQALLSPSHPHSGCPATPTHNQHNVTNTQHFSNQQHSSMIYHNTANTINTADVQNQNQYCYDRTSVPLYQMGPGDGQDTRPLPPSNPASHQMGGNASSTVTMTSEFVRQELRAIVGARTQQQQQRVPNSLQNNLSGQVSQDDLDALGLTFEMSSAGEPVVSDGPAKSWAIGSAGSAPSSSRTTIEEVAQGDPKASLLQKLLSE
ncbi:nuclear receptor coactivator 2 isoform X4 [Leptopilina heterotoma]|uniref:nuclear receptor coactivator 2 isoform X4 n=1 Tax=Leptopilina heterotoma TaxID=63436 RepID=UPI001CA86D04|nr:nuclear receptor coactivator 2 isoform X4 [Leptopilina heterotoma]